MLWSIGLAHHLNQLLLLLVKMFLVREQKKQQTLHKSLNYTTLDPKQLHKPHMKFWRQAQSTDTPDQLENRMGQETGDKLGWETSQEGEHSTPDQMGDKLGDKTRDKKKTSPGGADTASQMKDKLRDKTKTKAGRQDQRQEKDKTREVDRASQTRWETRWETRPETSPARRTQHPSQGGHTKKALRTPTVNCLGNKLFGGKPCAAATARARFAMFNMSNSKALI